MREGRGLGHGVESRGDEREAGQVEEDLAGEGGAQDVALDLEGCYAVGDTRAAGADSRREARIFLLRSPGLKSVPLSGLIIALFAL